ncbi:MAG: hydantoinase/oxoprolinase family protein [Pseudomonadota bacterium]
MQSKLVGVDVGGTFTDLVLVQPGGLVEVAKVPTTPDNQAIGVLRALEAANADLATVATINHGTTTTTNALLERKIATTGLITTKGFRDVLELGRRTRPQPYGLLGHFEPLIPRERRLEVAERISADGEILVPLDEQALRSAISELLAMQCESLVIHFLHSYRNPMHERRALAIAAELWPNRYVTAGHTVLSEYREYERGVTATVNAAIQPVLERYLARLDQELAARGFGHDLLVMQGNGGSVAARIVIDKPVDTVMSGPASGVMAAAALARATDRPHVITYDMGGTSSDVGLIQGGVPQVTAELELDYAMPIHVPMVDVHSIGAGGGSIAVINDAGMLQVGPDSAGAQPGPICYGRGGERPTITDANLLLGRLDPAGLLSVDSAVPVGEVAARVEAQIGAPLGLDAEAAAAAVLRVANDRMAGAIRMVSLARGHDPRDFALFAYGGAGPLHAGALARELGIPSVLIPVRPGITNAIGCVTADLRHDYVNTVNNLLADLDMGEVQATLEAQIQTGRETIEREAVTVDSIEHLHFADMQFQGQTHMLSIALPSPTITRQALQGLFDRAYWERFAVELPEIRAVLVNLHTAVIGRRPQIDLRALAGTGQARSLDQAQTGERRVWFEDGWHLTPVYRRPRLPFEASVSGPAILEQLDATTVVAPGDTASLEPLGNLVIEVKP